MEHIHSVSLDQNSMGIGPLFNGTLKCVLQVFLMRSVVDDGNTQTIVVSKISLLFLAITLRDALDLLEFLDLEDVGTSGFAE
jgi:hypothetical protein